MIAVHGRAGRDESALNVAVGLARLDVPVRLTGSLPDDPGLRGRLESEGVELGRTGRLPSRAAALHLHAAALAGANEDAEELVRRGKGRTLVSVDLSGEDPRTGDSLDALLGLATMVRVGRERLARLAPGEPPETVAEPWLDRGPALVLVTLGADGAVALGRQGSARRPADPVRVVDTVGAGDAFTAGVLAWLHRRGLCDAHAVRWLSAEDLADALGFATRVAGLACARAGASPPTLAEVEAGR